MNKTIHELNALVSLANDDELIVYDVATGTSKKIKKSDLKNQLAGDLIVDAVQDGNLKAVTSNAVFDSLVGKTDNNWYGNFENTATSIKDALTQVFNSITVTDKTVMGSFGYMGIYMFYGYKYTGGQYGMLNLTRVDGISYIFTVLGGVITLTQVTTTEVI